MLERGILASLDVTISVDVHFLEDVENVSHAGLVVLNVSKNSVDTVVLVWWGSAVVANDIAVVEWLEDCEEDVTTVSNRGKYEVGVESGKKVSDAKIPLGAGAISIISWRVSFLVTLGLGVIIVLTEVGNEFIADTGKSVSSNDNSECNDEEESWGLDSVVPVDSGVEANGIGSCFGNSSINLVPDVTGSDEAKDDDEERPELPCKDNNNFEQVNEVAERRTTGISLIETSGKANACINRFDNNVGSGG